MYHDPKGTRSLEQTDYHSGVNNNKNTPTDGTADDNYYKRRIESLNEEIKTLNEKNTSLNRRLSTVAMHYLFHYCV